METSHLPGSAEAQADAIAAQAAAEAAETKAKDARRRKSLNEVQALGKAAAQGSVALMTASAKYQAMVLAGDADAEGDAAVWYQAFAKGWNAFDDNGKALDASSGPTMDAKDADAVSRWRTFVKPSVLIVTQRYAGFYAKVLALRQQLESEERDSTYNTLLVCNRRVNDASDISVLMGQLDTDFDGTVLGWLRKGKAAPKSDLAKVEALVANFAKIAKRTKSESLDAATVELVAALAKFRAELESQAQGRASDDAFKQELLTAAQAASRMNVGGETLQ